MTDLAQGQAGTWYVIHDASGNAVSETGDPPNDADLAAKGLTKKQINHRPDPSVEIWYAATKTLKARVAAKTQFEADLIAAMQAYQLWQAIHDREITLGAPAARITALQNRADAAYVNVRAILASWQAAT